MTDNIEQDYKRVVDVAGETLVCAGTAIERARESEGQPRFVEALVRYTEA